MPWPNWLSGDLPDLPQGWLYTYAPSASGPACFKVETGSFWSVMVNPKMYFCPRDDTNSAMFKLRGQLISSYVMNGAVCAFGRTATPVKLAQLSPAGVKIAIYGAFDGSAKMMKLTEWSQKVAETGPNELWCVPGSTDGK